MRAVLALALLLATLRGSSGVSSCFSCVQMSAGSSNSLYRSAMMQIFGQWPAASSDCRSGPGAGEITPCNSFCVTQTFSLTVPFDPNGGMSGIVRGCASTVLKGMASSPPLGPNNAPMCVAHHYAPLSARGLILARTDTVPCSGSNCNGGPMPMNLPACDNPCAHNTCPKGACAQTFDQVSYTCGGVIPSKVPPTAAPSSAGWNKAAQMFLNAIDFTADPCQDFWQFSCGTWIKNNPIPPTRSSISQFGALQMSLLNTVGGALAQPTNNSAPWPAAVQQARNLYQSCVNVNGMNYNGSRFDKIIKQAGDWPILNQTWKETAITLWTRSGALSAQFGVNTFITPSVDTNWKKPTKHALYLGQATLTYPAVYYNDPHFRSIIRSNLVNMMFNAVFDVGLANGRFISITQVIQDIDDMINLEFTLAGSTVPPSKERQYLPLYNPYTVATASAKWPQINWKLFLATYLEQPVTVDPGTFIVTEPSFMTALNNQLAGVDSVTIPRVARLFQNYLIWRLVHSKAQFLPYILGFENFAKAYAKAKKELEFIEELPATPNMPCTSMVINNLPYAAGRLYIDFHFNKLPNAPRALIQKMTTAVMGSFRQMVANLKWMDAVTKAKAVNKVNNLLQNYAYPDWILNNAALNQWYAGLNIKSTDILWDAQAKLTQFQLNQVKQMLINPTNRRNWGGTPAIVNAWYQPELNSITFPAGILNPPFFEADFPDAVNYGAMGIVEGHELTHGFDDQGVQWDGVGTLAPWIDAQSLAGFKSMAQCVIDEYHSFCYKFNMTQFCVNGVQTQGEDIADNGGMKSAYLALKSAEILNGPQPRLPGKMAKFTNDQLFFLSFGNIWCSSERPGALQQQVLTDPHSPARVRVVAAIRNFPPFQKAFNCPANAPMSPTKHCNVW